MAFEVIECLNPPKASNEKVPDHGILIAPRKLGSRHGKEIRYIRLQIGAKLASAVSLTQEGQKVLLLFGTEADAGKIRVAVPSAKGGGFTAKRTKAGSYFVTINGASADGLFSLNFPAFSVEKCEPICPSNGQSPHFVFQASAEMLAAED